MFFEYMEEIMNMKEEMKLHQWAQDMAEQKASGLSQKKWCKMKGICTTTFEYRCRRVRSAMEEKLREVSKDNTAIIPADKPEERSANPKPFFAKVNLTSACSTPSGINIKIRDILVNIAPDSPAEHVRMVLEVLTHAQ